MVIGGTFSLWSLGGLRHHPRAGAGNLVSETLTMFHEDIHSSMMLQSIPQYHESSVTRRSKSPWFGHGRPRTMGPPTLALALTMCQPMLGHTHDRVLIHGEFDGSKPCLLAQPTGSSDTLTTCP